MSKRLNKLFAHCDLEDVSPKEIEWLWEVKEATPFLDWLSRYVDDSNCISNRQLQKFSSWCENGKELFGKDLDQALEKRGIVVEECLSSDVSEFELEFANKQLEELRAQNNRALEIESLLSDEIQKSMANEKAMEVKLKTSQAACQKEGQNLMKINVPLKATMSNLFGNFLKLISTMKDSEDPDIKNCYLSSMPLENTIKTCEKFVEYANLCLKRKFDQPSYNENHSALELMSFLDQDEPITRSVLSPLSNDAASELLKKMWKSDIRKISVNGTLCGCTAAVHHLMKLKENLAFQKYNSLQMKMEVVTLHEEISRLKDDIELLLKHEVADMVEDIVNHEIFRVAETVTKHRIERRQLMLRSLCSVANVTQKFIDVTDVVWMLLINECQRFRFGTDLLKEISDFLTDELAKHKSTMNGLNNSMNDYNSCTNGQRSGQALLVGVVQRLLDLTTDNSDSGNETLSEVQLKEVEYTQLSDILESFEKRYAGRENAIYELLSQLTNGATKKPNLVKKELVLAMQKLETELKICNADAESLATTFSSHQYAFKNSPTSQNRRLLWAWFLVAPDQLEKAVQLAEESKKDKKK